jgi:hypothetical protein
MMLVPFLLFLTVFSAGCGHNAVLYSDGVGVELGFVPEQYQVALNFRYGKIFSAAVREKTRVTLTTDASNDCDSRSKTGVKTSLSIETGDQTNGYTVDLEKVRKKTGTDDPP